ncbi:signal peptidase I [Microbacterium sp. BK668]|uniref:signal peptidase I n=1 Tax=Microbacterium sp. BK668 TaxID=2512118 RepID=UPI00105D83C4|nr:signal peptidase I [Microbacterium sp. BK668]TDN91138.1 signal peptidase I [Microbacterium sp. BK668]
MSAATTIKALGNTAIVIAAVVACAVAALMFVPGLLGFDRYVITGASMSGTFERGTLVLERQVPVSDLEPGDIITYLPPAESGLSELVTHRIVSVEPNPDGSGSLVFRTKGDANATVDPWTFTLADVVQPRVEGWIPAVGWAFIALSAPGIRMLAIGVPAAVVALLFLRDLVRTSRRRDEEAPAPADAASTALPVEHPSPALPAAAP